MRNFFKDKAGRPPSSRQEPYQKPFFFGVTADNMNHHRIALENSYQFGGLEQWLKTKAHPIYMKDPEAYAERVRKHIGRVNKSCKALNTIRPVIPSGYLIGGRA